MDQNMFDLGVNAARLLLQKIRQEDLSVNEIVLENRLIERQTTAVRAERIWKSLLYALSVQKAFSCAKKQIFIKIALYKYLF